jgi:hypothetical protein
MATVEDIEKAVLAVEGDDGFQWFWIGSHADDDDLIK